MTYTPIGESHIPAPIRSTEPRHSASLAELQNEIARLNMMVQTLARLLLAKGVVQEQELDEWMRYVDGLDGNVDGKLRRPKAPKACNHCKRMNSSTATRCQYCGDELATSFLDEH